MEICFTYGGKRHCFFIPIYLYPINWHIPGPGPVNYQALIQDATIVASLSDLAKHVSDDTVRGALQHGIAAAVKGMQERAGKDVTINAAPARG
jgi:hypothetical protein